MNTTTTSAPERSALQSGCDRAYARLVLQETPRLRRLGIRLLGCRDEAEDCLQDALIRAYDARCDFEGRSTAATWLYQIMLNTCRMKLRSNARRQRTLLELRQAAPWFEERRAEPSTASADLFTWARRIEELPTEFREVLRMRAFEGLDTASTARALGVTESTVKVRLHRARAALRASEALSTNSRGSSPRNSVDHEDSCPPASHRRPRSSFEADGLQVA